MGVEGFHSIGQARRQGLLQRDRLDPDLTTARERETARHRDARTGKGGRPKRIGAVLGTPKHPAAATTTWISATVTRYGRHDTVDLVDTNFLWSG